jgi:hypothetical protein
MCLECFCGSVNSGYVRMKHHVMCSQSLGQLVDLSVGLLDPAEIIQVRMSTLTLYETRAHNQLLRHPACDVWKRVSGVSAQNLCFNSTSSILASICCLLAYVLHPLPPSSTSCRKATRCPSISSICFTFISSLQPLS